MSGGVQYKERVMSSEVTKSNNPESVVVVQAGHRVEIQSQFNGGWGYVFGVAKERRPSPYHGEDFDRITVVDDKDDTWAFCHPDCVRRVFNVGDPCPSCDKRMGFDPGQTGGRDEPMIPASVYCEDCGDSHFVDWPKLEIPVNDGEW